MKTEIEKRASKFIDETDTMQFTLMEMLVMFTEAEQCNIADVVGRSEQFYCDEEENKKICTEQCELCLLLDSEV